MLNVFVIHKSKMNLRLILISIILMIKLSAAHLNQQCYFGMCLNSILLPIQNAYCDNNNRCRCKENYVSVSQHRCVEAQYPGKPCENDEVCRVKDENSFCDTNRRSPICECKKNHFYDSDQRKCIVYVRKAKKSTPLFPMTAIILIACIGIFCGCGIICHNFRRQPELSVSNDNIHRAAGRRQRSNHSHRNYANNSQTTNNADDAEVPITINPPMSQSDNHSTSSKYDSLMYDEPPPRYEDAIRESSFPISEQLTPSSSATNLNHSTHVTVNNQQHNNRLSPIAAKSA